jgi:hypothetical protein
MAEGKDNDASGVHKKEAEVGRTLEHLGGAELLL